MASWRKRSSNSPIRPTASRIGARCSSAPNQTVIHHKAASDPRRHGVAAKRVRTSGMITHSSTFSRRLLIALLAGGIAVTAFDSSLAQPSRRPASTQSDSGSKEQASDAKRLPADVTTDHTVELAGRTLRFKATAGTIPINNGEGKLQAEIAFIAYQLPDTPAAARPLTFVLNGGPGASSAYLQLGALGPWRLPLDGIVPTSPSTLVPNQETWLPFN